MGRHQKVICLICEKSMRSDKLKDHSLIHKDLLALPEEEMKEELRVRHADEVQRTEREAKRQRIEEIVEEEG